MKGYICSTGIELPLTDPERCGRPAATCAHMRLTNYVLYACSMEHEHPHSKLLKGLDWRPIEEADAAE